MRPLITPTESLQPRLIKANAESLFRFNRFYKRNGHKGRAQPEHHCWGLEQQGQLVAALRLEPHPWGNLLRGLWVHKQHRGSGMGGKLIRQLRPAFETAPCFCLPYLDVIDFYRRHGFIDASQSAPAPLHQQWQRYNCRGEPLGIMRYQPQANPTD